jgi:hypothetical protein
MMRPIFALALCLCATVLAQEPIAVLEGQVTDPSGASVPNAEITARNAQTGFEVKQQSASDGVFRFSRLDVGEYELRVTARGFAPFQATSIRLDIGRTIRIPVKLEIASGNNVVTIIADGANLDIGPTMGNVVSAREAVDLPLNGRNFTQLGLLQPGVAPVTFGLAEAGGALRGGQAYAVNGQRPESNMYLLDGVLNLNNVDGGYVIATPVDAIAEFRIISSNATAEYGGTSGATTTVVTKSGGNRFHGNIYEFLRNDAFDARNFFAATTEPLHRNQFGGTLGGPIRRNKDFFFVYYEGIRDSQGITTTSIVPTPQQRAGDFSGLTDPQTGAPVPLINYFTGQPVPGNQIPPFLQSPIALKSLSLYPAGNTSPSLYTSTQIRTQNSDQGGFRLDHNFASGDQLTARFAVLNGDAVQPFSTAGSNVPGFPVEDQLTTYSATVAHTHLFSPNAVQTVRAAFFRNEFLFDRRLNTTPPSALGFQYQPTLDLSSGPPFLIVSGYASVGNPITGPRNTYQNNYAISYSLGLTSGRHSLKFGGEYSRNQINLLYGIATNGFFVFAPFPLSDSFASFLAGQSVLFFQGGGQFDRGLRNNLSGVYAQDEWRLSRRLMLSLGLRYEINTPFVDIRDRMNAFAPGRQSGVFPTAPRGLLFPGDPGVARGIAPVYYKALMPRLGLSWDPVGDGRTILRSAYGIYYDPFTNGVGGPLQAPVSALPWTQANQIPGPGFDIANPYGKQPPPFGTDVFVRPATVLTLEQNMRPPYAQAWNFSIQQVVSREYLLDLRYVGNKGTRVPRFIEGNPAVYGPGASAGNADQRRIYAGCTSPTAPCDFASVGLISNQTNSTYHAFQAAFSRRFSNGLSFLASYWYSKSLDYVSSFNVSGSAPRNVAGENDLAQNPFDLRAEHGPSLFDARNRFVFSGTYQMPQWKDANPFASAVLNGWQLNGIVTVASGTPFTVYDSANVSLQGSAPEITGFYSSRPDMITDPNQGPRTPEQWVSGSAFRRLNPVTEAGQFGNAGRSTVRGPGLSSVDLSALKNFRLSESTTLQFRAECFNSFNHANFYLPENDIASQNFGRILQAGPPRLFQFALKLGF